MKATVVDLRYKMSDVLRALDRNEKVTVLYHGKVKGVLMPVERDKTRKIISHPFFGMAAQDDQAAVLEELNSLRRSRYDDI